MRTPNAELQVLAILAIVQIGAVLFSLSVDTTSTKEAGSGGLSATLLLFALILAATALILFLIRLGFSSYLYTLSMYGATFSVVWFLTMLASGNGSVALAAAVIGTGCSAKCTTGMPRLIMSVVLSIGISVMMGLFFGPMALAGLLLLLSAYDYIAVRKTRHMQVLAEDVIDKKGPQLISIGPEDSRILIGMADFIFPSALCVSAYVFTSPATALLCAICSHIGLGFMLRGMDGEGMPAIPYGSLGIAGYLAGVALGL